MTRLKGCLKIDCSGNIDTENLSCNKHSQNYENPKLPRLEIYIMIICYLFVNVLYVMPNPIHSTENIFLYTQYLYKSWTYMACLICPFFMICMM